MFCLVMFEEREAELLLAHLYYTVGKAFGFSCIFIGFDIVLMIVPDVYSKHISEVDKHSVP